MSSRHLALVLMIVSAAISCGDDGGGRGHFGFGRPGEGSRSASASRQPAGSLHQRPNRAWQRGPQSRLEL